MTREHPQVLVVNTGALDDLMARREFVWSIQRWLRVPSKAIHISKLTKFALKDMDAVIFSGCPIKDDSFLSYTKKLSWLKTTSTPLLGICAGHELLGVIFGGKIQRLKNPIFGNEKVYFGTHALDWMGEFGEGEDKYPVRVKKTDPAWKKHFLREAYPAYHLNRNYVTLPKDFVCCARSHTIPNEVMRHRIKKIVGVQFHPEVLGHHFFFSGFVDWALKNGK